MSKRIDTYTKQNAAIDDTALGLTAGGVTALLNFPVMSVTTVTGNATATAPPYNGLTTVNVNAATATITIPASVPIGGRILIRKISAYDTTNTNFITIAFSGGEVCTPEQLAEIPIYGNGGNWLIEKVTSTRWEIVAGWDGFVSTDFNVWAWEKTASGKIAFNILDSETTTSVSLSEHSSGVWRSDLFSATPPDLGQKQSSFRVGSVTQSTSGNWGYWISSGLFDVRVRWRAMNMSDQSDNAYGPSIRIYYEDRWYLTE